MAKPKHLTAAIVARLNDPATCEAIAAHMVAIASGKQPGDSVKAFLALRDTSEGDPHRKSLAEAIIETKLIELVQRGEIVPLPLENNTPRTITAEVVPPTPATTTP
jgi:hypothetical protein